MNGITKNEQKIMHEPTIDELRQDKLICEYNEELNCKEDKVDTRTLKEEARGTTPPSKTKNIADLEAVSVDFLVKNDSFTNNENEEVNIKYIEVNADKYRVPQSVFNALNVILEDKPTLKTFKVKKTGEGMDTRYTVIPLE